MNLEQVSTEELMRIAGVTGAPGGSGGQRTSSSDFSGYSDHELLKIAGLPALTSPTQEDTAGQVSVQQPATTPEDTWRQVIGKSLKRAVPTMARSVGGVVQAAEEFTGLDAGLGRTAAEFWGEHAKPYDLNVPPRSAKSYVGQAVESLATNAPGLILGALTGNPAVPLAVMAGQSGGGQYAELREKGLSKHQAGPAAVGYGAAEAAFERLPVLKLLESGPLLKRILVSTGIDIPSEALTELVQAGIDRGTIEPNMTFGELKQRLVDAGIVAAISGPVMATATHPAVRARDRFAASVPPKPDVTSSNLTTERGPISDQKDIQRLPGEKRIGQEPVEAQPVEVPSPAAIEPGGVLQKEEQVEGSPAAHIEALSNEELADIAGIEPPAMPDKLDTLKAPEGPAVPKKPRPKLPLLDGERDLLNVVDEIGGIRPRPKKGVFDPANYDGWDEVMKSGPARMIVSNQGLAPDDMRQALANAGYAFESTSEMYDAIARAVESRRAFRAHATDELANQKFAEAAYENKGKSAAQKGQQTLEVQSLKIGDQFNIKGEPLRVVAITPEGEVTVEDGRKFPPQTLIDGETIYPDRNSFVERPAAAVEYDDEEAISQTSEVRQRRVAEGVDYNRRRSGVPSAEEDVFGSAFYAPKSRAPFSETPQLSPVPLYRILQFRDRPWVGVIRRADQPPPGPGDVHPDALVQIESARELDRLVRLSSGFSPDSSFPGTLMEQPARFVFYEADPSGDVGRVFAGETASYAPADVFKLTRQESAKYRGIDTKQRKEMAEAVQTRQSAYDSARSQDQQQVAERKVSEQQSLFGAAEPAEAEGYIKVYHGTNAEFEGKPKAGSWFTLSPEQARAHGRNVRVFYIKPRNAVDLRPAAQSKFDPAQGEPDFSIHQTPGFHQATSYKSTDAAEVLTESEFKALQVERPSLKGVAKQMANAGERSKQEAANEIVGELGMKAAGQPKAMRSFDDSPLFGSKQGSLFEGRPRYGERGVLLVGGPKASKGKVDYSGIDDQKTRPEKSLAARGKERAASWVTRTIRRTTDRFVDLRRLVEQAAEQNVLKGLPEYRRWKSIDDEIVVIEAELGDLEGSSRAVQRKQGMQQIVPQPMPQADLRRLGELRQKRDRLFTERERLGRKLTVGLGSLKRKLAAVKTASELPPEQDPAKQAQIAHGGGLGKAQLALMDYGDVFTDARKEGLEDGLSTYLRLMAKERGISVVEEKLRERLATLQELGPKLRDLESQIAGLEGDVGQRRYVENMPKIELEITRRNELKLEALRRLRNDYKGEVEAASADADRYQRLLQSRQAVPDQETHETIAAKLAEMKRRSPEAFPVLQDLARRVFALNRQALDMAHDEGLISEEAFQKWTARGDEYVPLTRVIEEAEIDHGEGPKPGTFQAKQQFQPLEGGTRELEDPLRASMDRYQSIVKQVEKNRVVKNLVSWMVKHDDLVDITPLSQEEKAGGNKGEIAFYHDGELQRFAIDKTLADVLTMSPPHIAEFTGGALVQFAGNVAKAGITGVNLAFSLPNVARDIKTLAMVSKAGVRNPAKHPGDLGRIVKMWISSLMSQSNKNPQFREFLESGAAFSTLQSNITPEYFSRVKSRSQNFNPLYWFAQVNNRLETATKLASFRIGRERGMSPAQAAWETRNFGGSPDFGRRGTQGPVYNALFLYFNARMQGTLQNLKGAARDPVRMGYLFAAYTAAALALQAWNNQFEDEEGEKEWDRLSDHDRKRYQVILLPGTEQKGDGSVRHQAVKIPKSQFEQLWFNPVQEAIARLFGGKVDAGQAALDFASGLTPMSGEIRKGRVARDVGLGFVASLNPLLKEGIEQYSNFDSYRRQPIVPRRLEKVDPRFQYTTGTSEAAKRAGQAAGVSPLRLEHAARSFGGGTAESLLSLGDAFLRDTARPREGQEKATRLPVIGPILRRFIGTSGDAVAQPRLDGFYELKHEAEQVQATYRDRAKANPEEARRYLEEDPSRRAFLNAGVRKRLNSMGAALSKLHQQIRQVAESQAPEKAKKERIRALHRAEMNVLKQAEQLQERVKQGAH